MTARSRARTALVTAVASTHVLIAVAAHASPTCPDEQATAQLPSPEQVKNICEKLKDDVRTPGKFRLDVYEAKLSAYLGAMCHRNAAEVRSQAVR